MSDLTRFHNIHPKATCLVVGNGPSLDNVDLVEIQTRFPKLTTFGSNQIYRKPFTPTYYSMIDKEMIEACLPLPESFNPKESFIRAEYAFKANPIYPIVENGFSLDINNFVVMGGTVTYVLLQIAYYMGFETVLLVGVDHSYETQKLTGHKFVAGKQDPDHFTCADGQPYFETGKTFNAPELQNTTRMYAIAKEVFDKSKRRIINLTPNTKLDVFQKDTWSNWI